MTNQQQQVLRFMRAFEQHLEVVPQTPPIQTVKLRMELIQEETKELLQAMDADKLEHIAKEAADLLYVLLGMCNSYGFDLEPVFDEVHRSNMTKVGGHVSPSGKILKPSTYTPANVAPMLVPWKG